MGGLTDVVSSAAGWYFIPQYATKTLLPVANRFLGKPANPQQHNWRARAIYAFVCFSYLLFNFVYAIVTVPRSHYQHLGVSTVVDDEGLKIAFRQFARRFHPDRVGEHGTEHFVRVRDGYEVLKDPVTRWAYDLFGDVTCRRCVTEGDHLLNGLQASLSFHIVSVVFLFMAQIFGGKSRTAYWRWLIYLMCAAAEFSCILVLPPAMYTLYDEPSGIFHPSHVLYRFLPELLPHQQVKILHQAVVFLSLALSHVFPVLFPAGPEELYGREILQLIKRVGEVDEASFKLVMNLFDDLRAMDPSLSRQDILDLMIPGMEKLLIQEELARPDPAPAREHTSVNGTLPVNGHTLASSRAPTVAPNGAPAPTRPPLSRPPTSLSSRSEMLRRRSTQNVVSTFERPTPESPPDVAPPHPRWNHDWLQLPPLVRERSDSPPVRVRGGSLANYDRGRSKSV